VGERFASSRKGFTMGSTFETHVDRDDRITFGRLTQSLGLRISRIAGDGGDYTTVNLFATPDVLADLLITMTTWSDVVELANKRLADDGCAPILFGEAPQLTKSAIAYFRAGFEQCGLDLRAKDMRGDDNA
jgi:hypothetical protein